MMTLTPYRILVHYDHPEVLLCADVFGAKHLMTRVDFQGDQHRYYGVQISDRRLRDFLSGSLDLRAALVNPEKKEWSLCSVDNGILSIDTTSLSISQELLPLDGFDLGDVSFDDEEILEEAAQYDSTIMHLALSEKNGGNEIDLTALSDISKLVQAVLRHIAKKIASFSKELKETFRGFDPGFNAIAINTGSFKLHLRARDNGKNLLNGTITDVVLEHLDNLLMERDTEDEIIKAFRPYDGHAITAFNNLVEQLNKHEVSIKYAWNSPANQIVHRTKTDRTYLTHVAEVLRKATDLPPVKKTFVGKLEDIGLNRWRVFDEDSQTHVSGKTSFDGQLDGAVFHSTIYRLNCEERIQELEIKEAEKKTYVLITYEPIA